MTKQRGPLTSVQSMRFHIISLPHTQTTLEYESCAYTSKVRKFSNMMKSLGHTVYLYASEDNEAACDELITIAPKVDQSEWFGEHDYKKDLYNLTWDRNDRHWVETNTRAIAEIRKRLQPKDFICVIGGNCQQQIAEAFPEIVTVEFGIGYGGTFSKYRVFESYAWMHYIHGLTGDDGGRFFDTVIPNYFETELFPYQAKKDDYFLFLGRLIDRKGPEIAVEVARRMGAKLILAGQGVKRVEGNKIIGHGVTLEGDHIQHVGHADVKKRAELLGGAKGVFMPTTYIEPFGGVSIESLLCGTPVIATDFGVFPENIQHGVHGYRFRTIGEAEWGARHVNDIDSKLIHQYAVDNFSVERIKYLYQAYFEQVLTLWDKGFYSSWDTGVSTYHRYQRY